MCGIAGIFGYGGAPPVDPQELLRIRDAMVTRGPDGAGLWISSDHLTGLAHRRLAIIDLSESGAQPMASADGRLHITFNGEIYNYRELRKELESNGYRFRSSSDTEVLLHLYHDRGEDMLDSLRGMYAFGIWDDQSKDLFLARDPFGIKPLYYSDDGKVLRFASQVKALLKSGVIDTTPEPAGSVGFLVWGSVPEPYTLYKGVRSLPAGSYMRISRSGSASITSFFDLAEELRVAENSARVMTENARGILRDAVADSVRHHQVSDVPVGLFLSAGLDSTTLAGLASAPGGTQLNAITLGFPEFRGIKDDEVPLATRVANNFGIHHETHWVTRDDFESELERIMEAMDQPTIDGVNTYFVSRAAARAGMKVALSGLGGDELFGGYPSFRQVPKVAAVLGFSRRTPFVGRFLRRVVAGVVGSFTSPKYASALEYGGTYGGAYLLRRALYMPWEVESLLGRTTTKEGLEKLRVEENLAATTFGLRRPRSRIAALELSWYMRNQLLRDADWAGMAHSLEIRVPLVDVRLFRALAPLIASDQTPSKRDFAAVLETPLPDEVLSRPKSGFVTPLQTWLLESSGGTKAARGLREWARQVLPPLPHKFRALALVTDAYGGNGGIAKFNRDLLGAISSVPECAGVVAVPRNVCTVLEPVPSGVRFVSSASGSKLRFVRAALAEALAGPVDLVVVGHINLAVIGTIIAALRGVPSVLIIHGIDAWTPHKSELVKKAIARFTSVVAVSQLTMNRFVEWAKIDSARHQLLPNCVDFRKYGPGPKPEHLERRLGLEGRTVIMTLGRLASQERYKGFDEIIDALPALARMVPDITYVICGDGNDRGRLESKVNALGLRDRVVFTGFVTEAQKPDYYRLADAYVMPSRGEGFGIVFLEALACGLPVMGSLADGGREALLNGALGCLVEPSDPSDVLRGVLETLSRGKGRVPDKLTHYSEEAFSKRTQLIVRNALSDRAGKDL